MHVDHRTKDRKFRSNCNIYIILTVNTLSNHVSVDDAADGAHDQANSAAAEPLDEPARAALVRALDGPRQHAAHAVHQPLPTHRTQPHELYTLHPALHVPTALTNPPAPPSCAPWMGRPHELYTLHPALHVPTALTNPPAPLVRALDGPPAAHAVHQPLPTHRTQPHELYTLHPALHVPTADERPPPASTPHAVHQPCPHTALSVSTPRTPRCHQPLPTHRTPPTRPLYTLPPRAHTSLYRLDEPACAAMGRVSTPRTPSTSPCPHRTQPHELYTLHPALHVPTALTNPPAPPSCAPWMGRVSTPRTPSTSPCPHTALSLTSSTPYTPRYTSLPP
ncbi:unnamed protein product [Chrysodeixis includens]|uniref:Uncharacterized protein n=1 Tax=Chrysodeixis includens TaxID=689277 RepID=A0A9P0FWW4_CHRIL|nr:unnamed protein product [Chrysodeixis includens]